MTEYDSDVMFASPRGICILRWHSETPAKYAWNEQLHVFIPLQFDDSEHADLKLYETPGLHYPAQVTKMT